MTMTMEHPHCQSLLLFLATLIVSHTVLVSVDAFVPSPSPSCQRQRQHYLSPLRARPTKSIPKEKPPPSSSEEESTIPAITERFLELTSNPNIAIVIDVENVRGKTAFELDHADLLDRLMVWVTLRKHALGRTLVVIDHGSKASAHLLHHHGQNEEQGLGNPLCVTFAGPIVKADDIIARDVNWLISNPESTNTNHVVVITADQELSWRCRSAARSFDGGPIENPTKLNSVLRKFDDGNVVGSKGKNKGGKKGRKKKSRAGRKRQYQRAAQQKEEAEEEEEEALDVEATDVHSSVKNEDGIVEHEDNERDKATLPIVEIITPQRFLEDLDYALQEWLEQQEQHTISAQSNIDDDGNTTPTMAISSIPIPTPVSTLQSLFELRGKILTIESALRKKCSLHKRHTMTGELRKLKEEWKGILSCIENEESEDNVSKESLASVLAWSLSSTISSFDEESNGSDAIPDLSPLPPSSSPAGSAPFMSWEDLTSHEQEKLLLRWGKRRGRTGTRREKTEDRIVLAERLRRQLELILDSNETKGQPRVVGEDSVLVNLYADYINAMPSAQ